MRRFPRHIKPITSGAVVALAFAIASPDTSATPVTLDFNGGTASSAVGSDFAARGVVFKALTTIDRQPPEYGQLNDTMPTMGVVDTGRNGNLPPSDPNADTFNIVATFTVPVDSVSVEVWTFSWAADSTVKVSALDSSGTVIGSTTVGGSGTPGGLKGLATLSGVGIISSLLVQTTNPFSDTMGIDNLTFNVVTPSPTPTPAPSVSATATPAPTATPTSQRGSFVIGDRNAVVGTHVTFWGAQWRKQNSLSAGAAPASFKGFANVTSANPPACGDAWKSDPGNSSAPPSSVSANIKVIAASSISQSGAVISGNIPKIVVVKTDPGYASDPGHAGTGTVVSVSCGK